MSGTRSVVGGFLVVSLSLTMVNSKLELDSPLRLAHCRATCLYKMNISHMTDSGCQEHADCSQCWETCRYLQANKNDNSYCIREGCGLGCQEACRYPWLSPSQKPPVQLTQHEEALTVTDSRVSWPATVPAVYLVTGEPGSPLWQTLEPSVRLPPGRDPATVRVLVVDRSGLAKVLSPAPQSPLHIIIRSLGLEERMGLVRQTYQGVRGHNSTSALTQESKRPWRLRVVSLIQQSSLVLAQIIWQPQQLDTASQLMYLVTWQVDGGVLQGNLLTNTSGVTLSLWPDTLYTIQISLFSLETSGSQSELLVLDTHRVTTGSPGVTEGHPDTNTQSNTEKVDTQSQSDTEKTDTHRQTDTEKRRERQKQVVAGVAAAVAMFLLIVLTLTWRWHHRLSLPHSKLVDEDADPPNIYRVFPPVVRLIGERKNVAAGLFSSKDNLLPDHLVHD